jgi:glycolate oxidase iron-sulfur subunit
MSLTPTDNPLKLDERTYARGLACVHCGLCLPACPTYTQNYNEADSPRGRISLMLGLSDGTIPPTESVKRHLDLCLDCRGCETICPSGVVYHELIEEMRAKLAETTPLAASQRLMRFVFFHILTHPWRLKLALLAGRVGKALGLFKLLPQPLRKMGEMLPRAVPLWPRRLPRVMYSRTKSPAGGAAFFTGCIGSVVYARVNRQAAELLQAAAVDVHIPRRQVCCGAIHLHNGDEATARDLARRNIDQMPSAFPVVTTIAGCGAMLREYGHLLRDDPQYAQRAADFSARVRDITQVLLEHGPPVMSHAVEQTVTYHDACHLIHAQQVAAEPRALLAAVPGLTLVPLPESDICCGAAGTYNLTEPKMAADLAARKLSNIASTGCATCVAGNVGCAMHLQSQARQRGQRLEILHPVQILHRAVFGARPRR